MVHTKELIPTLSPVTEEVGELMLLMVPLPSANDQVPVPTEGLLAANTLELVQMFWLGPALEVEGARSTRNNTVSTEGGQEPLVMVQANMLLPGERPVTDEVGELTEVMVPLPDTSDQVPVPIEGVLPEKLVLLEQMAWSRPALAVVGNASVLITTVSRDGGQTPLAMVHTKMLLPTLRPVTDEVGELMFPIAPVPAISVQVPVPVPGVLAAKADELEQMAWSVPACERVGGWSTVMRMLALKEVSTQPGPDITTLR